VGSAWMKKRQVSRLTYDSKKEKKTKEKKNIICVWKNDERKRKIDAAAACETKSRPESNKSLGEGGLSNM